MAGFTTSDSVVFRVQALLQQYHATELALIDTRNNGLAGVGSENYFITPTVAQPDFQRYVDRNTGKAARIIVTDDGRITRREMQLSEIRAATMPRLDHDVRIGIRYVYASNNSQAEGADGARLRCNRLALAGHSVMMRYVRLDIPDAVPAVDILVGSTELLDFGIAEDISKDSINAYAVQCMYGMRLTESRT